MPVLFVGHGSPLNAIEDNRWSRGFRALGRELPRPRAVLCVSAHWWTAGSFVTGEAAPRTIHDFGGFPQQLHEVSYPAPGSPGLARRVVGLLADRTDPPITGRADWGLDHGAWSVLCHLFPDADIPVVQLSLDGRLGPREHLQLGRALRPLRDEGVLLLGSGNVTHNLRDAFGRVADAPAPDWAREFDEQTAAAIRVGDTERLIAAWPGGPHAQLAHPHPDHWFPLLYAAGAAEPSDRVSFPLEGFDLGSLSMRSVLWSAARAT